MRSDGGPEGARGVAPSNLSGRATPIKTAVREDFAGLFYLLLFSALSPVLIKTMGYEFPDHLAKNQLVGYAAVTKSAIKLTSGI